MPPKHTYTHAWMHAHIRTMVEFILRGFGLLNYFFLGICQISVLGRGGAVGTFTSQNLLAIIKQQKSVFTQKDSSGSGRRQPHNRLASSIPLQVLEGDP